MKILSCCVFVCLFSFSHSFAFQKNVNSDKQLRAKDHFFLVALPRSGSTWMQYIIRSACNKMTAFHNGNRFDELSRSKDIKSCCIKVHDPRFIYRVFPKMRTQKNNLVVVIRNYKEALGKKSHMTKFADFHALTWSFAEKYYELLNFYESWKGRKLLIYYEDLMQNPGPEIQKICQFFRVDNEKAKHFMEKYEWHKENSIATYNRTVGNDTKVPSRTQGKDTLFYSKEFSKDRKLEVDRFFASKFPWLFKKYLLRYIE